VIIMKTIIGAIALLVALPAAAQTAAPAANPHAGHEQGKAEHDCKACCEKMKKQGGKMECMDHKGGQDGHQGHDKGAATDAHHGHQPN
jgi:hypothetical protein